MMLVSAFASKENIMNAYEEAIKERYRFLRFGDAMLIVLYRFRTFVSSGRVRNGLTGRFSASLFLVIKEVMQKPIFEHDGCDSAVRYLYGVYNGIQIAFQDVGGYVLGNGLVIDVLFVI